MSDILLALDESGPDRTKFKFGRNSDIDSAGNEDIIEQGGLVQYDSGGVAYEVVSADNSDNGVVWLEGVDANYDWVREYVTMNGTTPVSFETSFYSTFRARAAFVPAGQITFRRASDDATRIIIPASYGGTLFAAFTIPRNYRIAISSWEVRAKRDVAGTVAIYAELLTRVPPDGPWTIQDTFEESESHTFSPAKGFDGPLDIRLYVAECGANDIRFKGNIGYTMRKLDYDSDKSFGPKLVNPQ